MSVIKLTRFYNQLEFVTIEINLSNRQQDLLLTKICVKANCQIIREIYSID